MEYVVIVTSSDHVELVLGSDHLPTRSAGNTESYIAMIELTPNTIYSFFRRDQDVIDTGSIYMVETST